MKFYTQHERPEKTPEINRGERLTERAGYIPPKIQIENMIYAGQRLAQARAEAFDYPQQDAPEGPVNDSFDMDPTRMPNFDLADATALSRASGERIRASQEAAKAEREKKAAEDKAEYEAFKASKKVPPEAETK